MGSCDREHPLLLYAAYVCFLPTEAWEPHLSTSRMTEGSPCRNRALGWSPGATMGSPCDLGHTTRPPPPRSRGFSRGAHFLGVPPSDPT